MANRRIRLHRLQEMIRLRRKGVSAHKTARLLGMSPNTERKYRKAFEDAGLMWGESRELPELARLKEALEASLPARKGPQEASTVAQWEGQVLEMVKRGAGPKAIWDRLRLEEEGFSGSLGAIKRLVRRLKKEQGVRPEEVAIPVETAPGEVGQVDFGYVGRLYDPQQEKWRKAWVFVMVLGYSRHMFCRVVFEQSAQTWQRLHVQAFDYFGGAVQVLVPDNLKAAVIRRAFGSGAETTLNRSYVELARHYGCLIDPTPVRAPEKKGKVESAVKYVKGNFFAPREPGELGSVNKELERWAIEIAGERNHGTTGRPPLELFEQERGSLQGLPERPYEVSEWRVAKVGRDSHIQYRGRLFSVPWQYVGSSVWVRVTEAHIEVFNDELRLCWHRRSAPGWRVTNEAHLPEHRVDLRHRDPEHWKERAQAVGPEAGALVAEIFEAARDLSPLRQVQGMVKLLEGVPTERAQGACRRARYFGTHSYGGLKRILEKGLDLAPLPEEKPASGALKSPRFARGVEAYLPIAMGVDHVSN